VGNPRTRWEDVFRKNTLQIIEMWGWRRWTEVRGKWKHLLREARAQRGVQRHKWMDESRPMHVSYYVFNFESTN
jgi:hypothetical protein